MFIKNVAIIGLLTSTSIVNAAGPLGLNLGGALNAGVSAGGSIPTLGVNLNASGDMKASIPVLNLNSALQVDAYSQGATLSDLASITNFATTIENADHMNSSVNAVTQLSGQISSNVQGRGSKQAKDAEKPSDAPKPADNHATSDQPAVPTDKPAAPSRDKNVAAAQGSVEAIAKVASSNKGQSALSQTMNQASAATSISGNLTGQAAASAGNGLGVASSAASQMNGDAQVTSKHASGQLSASNEVAYTSAIQQSKKSLNAEGNAQMSGNFSIDR